MATVSLKLPDDVAARLDALARRRRTSRSELIRTAIESMLEKRPGRQTVGELAGDLFGIVSGPGDLSTSRKHMKGFGE